MELEKFEDLFVNNPDFYKIQAHLNRFNPIRIMRMEAQEIRHSNILSWLLNPSGNHGLGDEFLKSFLSEIFKGAHEKSISSLDLISEDLSESQIKTEWNRIDILIECPIQHWVFIIENKWKSKQHSNQLERYRKIVLKEKTSDQSYIDKGIPEIIDDKPKSERPPKVFGIYLTLQEDTPEDPTYLNTIHAIHAENLKRIIEARKTSLSDKVYNFIEYYYEVVMAESEQSQVEQKAIEIAQKLYREHREVIDFIVEKGSQSELGLAFASIVAKGDFPKKGDAFTSNDVEYIVQGISNRWVSFIPRDWSDKLNIDGLPKTDIGEEVFWEGCEKWRSGYPVCIWIGIHPKEDKIEIVGEIGPLSNPSQRLSLVHSISKHVNTAKFYKTAYKEGTKYSRFFTNKASIKDNTDSEEIYQKAKGVIDSQIAPLVDQVSIALDNFVSKIENR